MEVEEKRARRVRGMVSVNTTACELPDQPAVDRAREEASISGDERDLRLLEQPLEFGSREVRIRTQSRSLGDERRLVSELGTPLGGAAVLPHDRARERLSRVSVADDDRLALIGDADHV